MKRQAIAGLVLVGLVIGVWLLWPREDPGSSASANVPAASPTTTTTAEPDVTTSSLVTTTSTIESHVVETVAEAETILRELWFGWFEGIYNQDEERIREVVATEEQVETAKKQFGVMEFQSEPAADEIRFEGTEILRADKECLAVWTEFTMSGFRGGTTEGVDVLRWNGNHWILLSSWIYRDDLWETDCVSELLSSP